MYRDKDFSYVHNKIANKVPVLRAYKDRIKQGVER
jgi:hypothetical protein